MMNWAFNTYPMCVYACFVCWYFEVSLFAVTPGITFAISHEHNGWDFRFWKTQSSCIRKTKFANLSWRRYTDEFSILNFQNLSNGFEFSAHTSFVLQFSFLFSVMHFIRLRYSTENLKKKVLNRKRAIYAKLNQFCKTRLKTLLADIRN